MTEIIEVVCISTTPKNSESGKSHKILFIHNQKHMVKEISRKINNQTKNSDEKHKEENVKNERDSERDRKRPTDFVLKLNFADYAKKFLRSKSSLGAYK